MRFVLAISALVLSGILLILGVGQTTFLAGDRVIAYSAELPSEAEFIVIDAPQFEAVAGQANVVVSGVEPVIVTGQSRDVEAWIAPFPHLRLESDAASASLQSSTVSPDPEALTQYAELVGVEEGNDIEAPSLLGSDLWLEERTAAPVEDDGRESGAAADAADAQTAEQSAPEPLVQTVRMPVTLNDDQALIVSAEKGQQLDLSIEWVQDRRTPWAGPLLAAGGLFALIGAVLYLLAVDHDRRGLGPRRGRRGPLLGIRNVFGRSGGKDRSDAKSDAKASGGGAAERRAAAPALRRGIGAGALGLSAALLLSGCSPNYWPDLSPVESEVEPTTEAELVQNVAPVPVTQAQIDRILSDIAEVSSQADDALDAGLLGDRFIGDALESRSKNYTIRSAVSDYPVVVPRITNEALGYQLVQSTEGWPRAVFVVVASESDVAAAAENDERAEPEETPSLALILVQRSPHQNFLVSRSIALRGGITMPEAAPAEVGTALLANDLQSLALTPAEVGPAYAAVLAGGTSVEQAEHFELEGDSLITRSGAAWVAQSSSAAAEAGQGIDYSVSAAQSDSRVISLSTGTGGALVASTVLETRVEKPQEGTRWRPTVNPSMEALSGLQGQQDQLTSVVSHQLLFYVPRADSGEPIQMLGYTSDLIGVSN